MPKVRVVTPQWAVRMAETFRKRYGIRPVSLRWWNDNRTHGVCHYIGLIDIFIGEEDRTNREAQKIILLHELAHAVMNQRYGNGEGHSVRFYKFLWRQFRAYNCDLQKCFRIESGYMKNSVRAWKQVFKDEPLPVSGRTEDTIDVNYVPDGESRYLIEHDGKTVGWVEKMPVPTNHVWEGNTHRVFWRKMAWRGQSNRNDKMHYGITRKEAAFEIVDDLLDKVGK